MQPTRSQPQRQCQNRHPSSGQTVGDTNHSEQEATIAANHGIETTATELTGQSAPVQTSPSQEQSGNGAYDSSQTQLAELQRLPEFFKDEFDPATQATYEGILYSLIKQGPRRPDVRKKGQSNLRRLLAQHVDAVQAHNNFAQSYNADFEGKHERFHLPIFPDLAQRSVPGPDLSNTYTHSSPEPQQPQQPLTGREIHPNTIPTHLDAGQGVDPITSSEVAPVENIEWKSTPAQAAQSYIAWLRYRGSTFPTVAPLLTDANVLARCLGRPAAAIYDDITYHYGLETDSVRVQWYQENRLQVLGENPQI